MIELVIEEQADGVRAEEIAPQRRMAHAMHLMYFGIGVRFCDSIPPGTVLAVSPIEGPGGQVTHDAVKLKGLD